MLANFHLELDIRDVWVKIRSRDVNHYSFLPCFIS